VGGATVTGAACAASAATLAGSAVAGGPAAGAGAQASPIPPTSKAISKLGSQPPARAR
jgi:hypothetical protein